MIRKETVATLFEEFLQGHNESSTNAVWQSQSDEFKSFWNDKLMNHEASYTLEELKRIVQILDVKGDRSGSNSGVEGAAFVQIYQGDWENIFRGIKNNEIIREKLNAILNSDVDVYTIQLINELEEINTIKKLTGPNAVVLNDFLFVYNPERYTSVMSLLDRYLIMDHFKLGDSTNFPEMTYGERIIKSNNLILSLGTQFRLHASARTQAEFLYSEPVKKLWREHDSFTQEIIGAIAHINFGDKSGVYTDQYLSQFENGEWDHWNTPSDYLRGNPGLLLLYDSDRKGITIQAEVTEIVFISSSSLMS